MKPSRLALALAASLLATAAPFAHASSKPSPQVTDPCNDGPQDTAHPGVDLKSMQMSTAGKTTYRKVGRKRKAIYTPTDMVVVLNLCGPVDTTTPGVNYTVAVDTSACDSGSFQFGYRTYARSLPEGLYDGDLFISGCGTDSGAGPAEFMPDVQAVVSGSTIKWDLPLADLGSDLPIGSTFTNFQVRSDVDEPVTGELGTWFVGSISNGAADLDYAKSDSVWKLA
jgi:hypothetical protein